MDAEPYVLLCARDPALIEAVEVSAAALDISLVVAANSDEIQRSWPAAALRLIATEVAARWNAMAPGEAVLVGVDVAELARSSARLKVPVLALPAEHGQLAALLSEAVARDQGRGLSVCLIGAAGGLGTSTMALALAQYAVSCGEAAVAVDLAPGSGGLDLLAGAETKQGLRWPELAQAQGETGDIASSLPVAGGVAVLSRSRRHQTRPEPGAIAAVLSSLSRTARLIVIDGGREIVPGSDRVVMVVGADVRSIAAAREIANGYAPDGIVVRRGPGRTLTSAAVSRALGAKCLATVSHHRALPRISEVGLLPLSGATRRFRKEIGRLWAEVGHA